MPRKPTAQHIADGTYRHDRHDARRREPKPAGKPRQPARLSKDAKAMWVKIVPELSSLGIATAIDSFALQAMCEAWSEYRDALRLKAKTLEEKARLNRIRIQARRAWQELAAKFGLTPLDRSKLEVELGADETNPLEQMLLHQPVLKISEADQ